MVAGFSRRDLLISAPLALGLRPERLLAAGGPPPGVATGGREGGSGLVRLSGNENPYGPSPAAREAILKSLDLAWQYPVFQARELKELIARREGVSTDQVMIGDGSGEILRIAGLLFGLDKGEIVAPRPTFNFLQDYARRIGCSIREVPLDADMRHDLKAMAAAVGDQTSLVYVCNPNNPTGTLMTGAELRPFVSALSAKTTVLVDEAYLDLSENLREHTVVDRVIAGDNVIVTRTFSKLHGLAGLRIGYALARSPLIQRLEAHRMSMLNLPGLAAAMASYQDEEFQVLSRRKIRAGKEITVAAFEDLGLDYVRGGRGNFEFFDTGMPQADFANAMRQQGFTVGRPFAPYGSWCRVSMGTVEQMTAFAAALRAYYRGARGSGEAV